MVLSQSLQARSEQIHVHVNKVLLEHHQTHALQIVCGCSWAQQQSGEVTTETTRPTKPKLGTALLFAEVCLPMF